MSSFDVQELLRRFDQTIVLLDLGASGGTYKPFGLLGGCSRLVEVDPDDRDFEQTGKQASDRVVVTKAITGNKTANEIDIYLTADPHCSSTLPPDHDRLRNFSYDDLFKVNSTVTVPATSLDRLSAELGYGFDWMKIDTQGSELDILTSMKGPLMDSLICCDAEISLYPHYVGAGTFPEFHKYMVSEGFQVSDLVRVQSRWRLTKDDLGSLMKLGVGSDSLNRWPTSLELRYIRSINHDQVIEDLSQFIKIWAISFVTGNSAYCYFLARRLEASGVQHKDLARQLQQSARRLMTPRRGLVNRVRQRLNSILA